MLVSLEQKLGARDREPLRIGRLQYGLWWLEHTTAGTRWQVRQSALALVRSAGEIRWLTLLTVQNTAVRARRARPSPWSDRGLCVMASVIAVGALSVALVLGVGISQWARTDPNALLPAATGSIAVGVAWLFLMYLVFAARR